LIKLIRKLPLLFLFLALSPNSGEADLLKTLIDKMNSVESIRANITIDNTLTGSMSYKRPNLLHVKLSDGRVISANGRFLWFYSPNKAIAGKQDLDGSTGGISGLLSGYKDVTVSGNTILLKSRDRYYEEIKVVVDGNNMLQAIRLKTRDQNFKNISLSGIQVNIGLASNLFNLHPPASAQIIENPLNEKQ